MPFARDHPAQHAVLILIKRHRGRRRIQFDLLDAFGVSSWDEIVFGFAGGEHINVAVG